MADPRGFDPEGLDRLRAGLQVYVDQGQVPGALALVQRRGEEPAFINVGWADDEHERPLARDTLFRIGSMTKPIVSVAALTLIEQARLRLTDKVSKWLPELSSPKVLLSPTDRIANAVDAPRAITVEDLLTHRAGFATALVAQGELGQAVQALTGGIALRSELPPDEWMRVLGGLPLASPPGQEVINGFATDVLGVLISRLTGQTLPELLKERVLDPLAMVDTEFHLSPEKLHRLAPAYGVRWLSGKRWLMDHPRDSVLAKPPLFPSGSSGLISTADDYLRFGRMLLSKGVLDGRRILSRKAVELMTTNFLTSEQRALPFFGSPYWADRGLGLGVYVLDDLAKHAALGTVGQYGWGGAFATTWFNDPAEEFVALLMTQVFFPAVTPPIRADFETLVYQALN